VIGHAVIGQDSASGICNVQGIDAAQIRSQRKYRNGSFCRGVDTGQHLAPRHPLSFNTSKTRVDNP
jgi:hypothetical protein